MSQLAEALLFAADAHIDQTDKRGAPYVLHPIRVMQRLRAKGLPEMDQVVALLHDVVEDTEIALWSIRDQFGDPVADAVDALTRREGEKYDEYIDRCLSHPIALEVKEEDAKDNMDPERFHPEVPVHRYFSTLQKIQRIRGKYKRYEGGAPHA